MQEITNTCECGKKATIQMVSGVYVCEECYKLIREEINKINDKNKNIRRDETIG